MQVQIDEAASCGHCYTRRCIQHGRCVCIQLLNVRVQREERKVSALASMSKVGAVRLLTRLVTWKRRTRDRPGFVHAEQRCSDAALVLDASTRVAAAARNGLIDLRFAFVVDHADVSQATTQRAHVESCEEADLVASLGWI